MDNRYRMEYYGYQSTRRYRMNVWNTMDIKVQGELIMTVIVIDQKA